MKNISPKSATTATMKLSDFSNWLADFEQSDVINSEVRHKETEHNIISLLNYLVNTPVQVSLIQKITSRFPASIATYW